MKTSKLNNGLKRAIQSKVAQSARATQSKLSRRATGEKIKLTQRIKRK